MQKKLISGLVDIGAYNNTKNTSAAGVTTKSVKYGSSSGSATTNVTFTATEDLGGGMKAGAVMETDPTAGSSNMLANGASNGGLFNSQNYLFLTTNFGEFKAGLFNNAGLTPNTTSQPFGTGMAGGYGGNFQRLGGGGILNGGEGRRSIRTDNQIQYMTPSFSGFTASLGLHNGSSDAGSMNAASDDQQQIGLNYNNGPINASFTNDVVKGKSATAGSAAACIDNVTGVLTSVAACPAGTTTLIGFQTVGNGNRVTNNMFGANYTWGPVTGYYGYTSTKKSNDTINSVSQNIAIKYNIGAWSLAANFLRDNDKTVTDADRKLTGLGVDYTLSKRTAAYLRYEKWDNNTNAANNDGTAYQIGMRHSF
ncbi:MAG: porin [Rhodocyclales bacterium]|nr:porin [Rhodocyclales bacterium]